LAAEATRWRLAPVGELCHRLVGLARTDELDNDEQDNDDLTAVALRRPGRDY
jgi:hypothetical protein